MKRFLLIVIATIGALFLVACDKPVNKSVYFTKYYETTRYDTALELYNESDEAIDLSKYAIQIYSNGSKTVTYEIPLIGTIESKDFFLVTYNDLDSPELKENSDFMSDKLIYNGDDVIELVYKKQRVDIIGMIGLTSEFGKDVTLIKKLEYLGAQETYDPYHYIKYNVEAYQYLKTFEGILTNQELIEGPKMTDEVMSLPFIDPDNKNVGGGGFLRVTLVSVADGDTATFRDQDGINYTMRYYYIDTAEVIGTGSKTGQPWAYQASRFNKLLLRDAKENNKPIYIQSIKGTATRDNYGRFLGLVWVDGRLSNFDIVRAGMSEANVESSPVATKEMHYKNISYVSFLENISIRAAYNKWGVHDRDPYYDYTAGKPTITNWEDEKLSVPNREYDPEIDK